MSNLYTITYPERRAVTAETLILWASDAVANRDTDIEASAGELLNDMPLVIRILHDSGYATVARR